MVSLNLTIVPSFSFICWSSSHDLSVFVMSLSSRQAGLYLLCAFFIFHGHCRCCRADVDNGVRESETESKESLLYYNAAVDVEVLPVTHVPPQPPLLLCRIFTVEEIPPLSVCVCSGVTFLMVFTLGRISLEQLLLFDGDEGESFKFFFFIVLFLFFFLFPIHFLVIVCHSFLR